MKKTPKMDSSLRLCFVAIAFGFVFIMNGKLSSGTTPHEADPPQASNLAFSPEAAPPDTSAMDDDTDINYEPVPPFVPEFPVCTLNCFRFARNIFGCNCSCVHYFSDNNRFLYFTWGKGNTMILIW